MKIRSAMAAAAIAASCAALGSPAAARSDASNYQVDAAHDGAIRFEKGFHAPLRRKWMRDLGGTVSFPVFGDGLVFVTVNAGSEQLYALDPRTGATVWQDTLTGSGGTPAYEDGRVFVVNRDGLMQAINAADGAVAWSKQSGIGSSMSPPAVSGGLLYLTGGNGLVAAYNEKTGKLRWAEDGPSGGNTPAIADGGVFVDSPCHEYRYDARKGDLVWADAGGCSGGSFGAPTVYDNRVYIYDGILREVLDAPTGATVRQYVETAYTTSFWTPSSGSPLGFVVTNDGLTAFHPQDGSTAWSLPKQNISMPPLVVNDTVMMADSSGMIFALDAATGSQLWSKSVGTTLGDFTFQLGMGAGENLLVVPAGTQLSAWKSGRE